jgi:hypothetical protein
MLDTLAVDPGPAVEAFPHLLYLYGVGVYKVEEDGQDGRAALADVEPTSAT